MPAWSSTRSLSKNYASLLPTSKRDDDRLSPLDNQFRRVGSAQSEALSSSSSDDGGYSRNVQPLAAPPTTGRNHKEFTATNRHEPTPVQGSRASFTSSVPEKKTKLSSKRLSLNILGLKGALSRSGGGKASRRLASTAQETEGEPEDAEVTPQPKLSKSSSNRKDRKTKKESREAQTVLQIITGLDTVYLPFTDLSLGSPTSSKNPGGKARALPDVSSKEIKKLKASLTNPKEAPQIVQELKKIPIDSQGLPVSEGVHANFTTRAACLECLDPEAFNAHAEHTKSPFADQPSPSLTETGTPVPPKGHTKQMSGADLFTGKFQALSATTADGMPTPGKILGQVATSTGTFSALAGVTGRLIEASGSHEGLISPPCDRMSVLVYWWGYELVLPPPSLAYLGNARSVAGTLFTFLRALAMTGGVPEIAPFIRYISLYIDMEWKAISAQNKGKGVVLAATWVVPVAIIPRPYDLS